jgi:hypothetical protein
MDFAKLFKPAGGHKTGNGLRFAQYVALFFEIAGVFILLFSGLWLLANVIVFLYFNALHIFGILALGWIFVLFLVIGFYRHLTGTLTLLNAVALWLTVGVINLGSAFVAYQKIPEQTLTALDDFCVLGWLVCHCVLTLLSVGALLEDLGLFEDAADI